MNSRHASRPMSPRRALFTLSPFAQQWQASALAYVLAARREGTIWQSADSLFACVRTPPATLPGAPAGTNAAYFAREIFARDVIGTSPTLRAFTAAPGAREASA